jgi:hypothetical protein
MNIHNEYMSEIKIPAYWYGQQIKKSQLLSKRLLTSQKSKTSSQAILTMDVVGV